MFYLINKPTNISSFQAIKDFAKNHNIKKIGHSGTLDPLASGLLLIATDEDTKLLEYVDKGFKTYRVGIELNKISDTYDVTGEISIVKNKDEPKNFQEILLNFLGSISQTPPSFSAKKINGQRAYKLAREGQNVVLKPQTIFVNKIENISSIYPFYEFDIEVSRGTYIRSIVHELGQKLGNGAIMTSLIRTKIGNLSFDNVGAVEFKDISSLPLLEINDQFIIKKLFHGLKVKYNIFDQKYALIHNDIVCGIVDVVDGQIVSNKLLGKKLGV